MSPRQEMHLEDQLQVKAKLLIRIVLPKRDGIGEHFDCPWRGHDSSIWTVGNAAASTR
jgi:hypothetical protein